MGAERWRENWRAVAPPGAVRVELVRSRAGRRAVARATAALVPGTPVVVSSAGPRAGARCRRFASAAGVEVDREYLALPSAARPGYLVEDAPGPVDVLLRSVLVTPPGTRFPVAVDLGLAIVRALAPRRLIRALAPGRVAVGRRA